MEPGGFDISDSELARLLLMLMVEEMLRERLESYVKITATDGEEVADLLEVSAG